MKIFATNVIPPNVPSSRKVHSNSEMKNMNELQKQRYNSTSFSGNKQAIK